MVSGWECPRISLNAMVAKACRISQRRNRRVTPAFRLVVLQECFRVTSSLPEQYTTAITAMLPPNEDISAVHHCRGCPSNTLNVTSRVSVPPLGAEWIRINWRRRSTSCQVILDTPPPSRQPRCRHRVKARRRCSGECLTMPPG